MKLSAPTPSGLAAWCRERAKANAQFDGRLSQAELQIIRTQWPAHFLAIAEILESGPTSSAVQR